MPASGIDDIGALERGWGKCAAGLLEADTAKCVGTVQGSRQGVAASIQIEFEVGNAEWA